MDSSHESASEKVEKVGYPGLDLPGRHSHSLQKQDIVGETSEVHLARSGRSRDGGQPAKVSFGTFTGNPSSRVYHQLQRRKVGDPKGKNKASQKGIGKNSHLPKHDLQKNGSHFGNCQKFSDSSPIFEGFFRPNGAMCETGKPGGLGFPFTGPLNLATRGQETQNSNSRMARKAVSRQGSHKGTPFRCLKLGLGGLDSTSGKQVQEFWREYKCLHINVKEIKAAVHTVQALAKQGEMVHLNVDNSVCWAYLRKGGGRLSHLNALLRPFFNWCQEKQVQLKVSLVPSKLMQADKLSRTPLDKGDYTLDRNIFLQIQAKFANNCKARSRLFCLTRKQAVAPFHLKVATLWGGSSGCLTNKLGNLPTNLCKPTVELGGSLATKVTGATSFKMSDGGSKMGWVQLVAPTSKTALHFSTCYLNPSKVGAVSELPGREDATIKMAPSLCSALREILERKQVPFEGYSHHLTKLAQNNQYNHAFKVLWALAQKQHLNPADLSVQQTAGLLCFMHKYNQILQRMHIRQCYTSLALKCCVFHPCFLFETSMEQG